MKTEMVGRPGIIAIKFDRKSIFNTILGFNPQWACKHPNQYVSKQMLNLSTTNKVHLQCDIINGTIFDGLRMLIFSVLF